MRIENHNPYKRPAVKFFSNEIIFLIVSFFTALTLIFLIAVPQYKEIKIKEMKMELIRKNLDSKKDVLEKIVIFNKANRNISKDELDKINNLLPEEDVVEYYVANINNIASRNRILVDSFSVNRNVIASKKIGNNDKLVESIISFSAIGDFSGFISFLSSLEKSIPIADLINIEIIREEPERADGEEKFFKILKYEIKFLIYYIG